MSSVAVAAHGSLHTMDVSMFRNADSILHSCCASSHQGLLAGTGQHEQMSCLADRVCIVWNIVEERSLYGPWSD